MIGIDALSRMRPKPLRGASGQIDEFLKDHLDPVFLRHLCIAVCVQENVNPLASRCGHTRRESMLRDNASTRLLRLERKCPCSQRIE